MKEHHADFITLHQSLSLKGLGFQESCFGHFLNRKFMPKSFDRQGDEITLRPTHSQAFRWIRKTHGITACVDCFTRSFGDKKPIWYYEIRIDGEQFICTGKEYKSYEKAEAAALNYSIEIAKENS